MARDGMGPNATLAALAATYLAPWAKSGVRQSDVDHAHLHWADYRDPQWGGSVPAGKSHNRLLRVQVLGGRLYFVNCVGSHSERRRQRQFAALRLLQHVLRTHSLPDLDFVLSLSDRPTVPVSMVPAGMVPPPVFAYVTTPWHVSIPFPYKTFDPVPWASLFSRVSSHRPLDGRSPSALWRGSCNSLCDGMRGRQCTLPADAELMPRATLLHEAARCPALVDVGLVSTHRNCKGARTKAAVPIGAHAAHAVLMHVDGNGFSGRLDELFTLGAAILKQDSPFAAYYYPLLRAGTHYERLRRNLTDLCDTTASLVASLRLGGHGRARALAAAARRFADTFLSPSAVAAYVGALLSAYGRLQRYAPRRHPDAKLWEEREPERARADAYGPRAWARVQTHTHTGATRTVARAVSSSMSSSCWSTSCCERHPRACARQQTPARRTARGTVR